MVDANGNGIGHYFIMRNAQAHDTSACVEWFLLVKDEVANAVINRLTLVAFIRLQRMGVVTNDGIGASFYQSVGLQPLLGHRLQCVFCPPMQIDDDNSGGIGHFDGFYPIDQRVERLLTDAFSVRQIGKTLQWQAIGGKEKSPTPTLPSREGE